MGNAGEVALSNTSATVRVADGGSSVVKLTDLDDPSTVDLRLNCSSGAGQVALYVFAEYPLAHVAYGAPPEIGALAAIELLDCSTERTYCFDSAPDGVGSSDPWFGTGCAMFNSYTQYCGSYDGVDFASADMCCGCGGGAYRTVLSKKLSDVLIKYQDSFGTVYDHFTSAYVVVAPVAATPLPTPLPTSTASVCASTCYGETCDYWVNGGYTCEDMETTFNCECAGCSTCPAPTGSPTVPPTFSTAPTGTPSPTIPLATQVTLSSAAPCEGTDDDWYCGENRYNECFDSPPDGAAASDPWFGEGCSMFSGQWSYYCGYYDSDDFSSSDMCVHCL